MAESVLASGEVTLYCVDCGAPLARDADAFSCTACSQRYPVVDGTVRMLPPRLRLAGGSDDAEAAVKRRTGRSFGYEWTRFGRVRPEWRKNFLDYMQPHPPDFLAGKRVLDVGTGSGRHAREAAELGAKVTAVDIGESIDVARRNLPDEVVTVQADAEALPFAEGAFDVVMSIGVLHHMPDPARAVRELARYVAPGGHLHLYLYWWPPHGWHREVLRWVSRARHLTTRFPYGFLYLLCFPFSLLLFASVVLPYRSLRKFPTLARIADWLPLKTYADYPFMVLVNDQFDRFSAPIERRFTREEVEVLMRTAGLIDVIVLPHHGWIADGRRPER